MAAPALSFIFQLIKFDVESRYEMKTLFAKLQAVELQDGEIAMAWLGQSGYLFKIFPEDVWIIDPYLSDYCEQQLGLSFKRLMPAPITADELDHLGLSGYIMTHHHEDHYDPVLINELKTKRFPFYTTPTTIKNLQKLGVDQSRCMSLNDHSSFEQHGMKIHGVFADHGELAPDAIGIVMEVHNKVIFHMGDTCFNEQQFKKLKQRFEIDLLIVPINGKYGNMNEYEAVQAVALLEPKQVTPSHFWMLPGNSGGNVLNFMQGIETDAIKSKLLLCRIGEIVIL